MIQTPFYFIHAFAYLSRDQYQAPASLCLSLAPSLLPSLSFDFFSLPFLKILLSIPDVILDYVPHNRFEPEMKQASPRRIAH